MGALTKLIDLLLFIYFTSMAIIAPLIDGQTALPIGIYPTFLTDLKSKYISDFGDYLVMEKPHFLIGLVWHELLFLWPLSIANVYAILVGNKSWFGITCLLYGASLVTSMAAILGEMISSGKSSKKLLMMYVPFMGFGILALLRGLVSHSIRNTESVGKRSTIYPRRKLA